MLDCNFECEFNTVYTATQLFLHNNYYKNRAKLLKNTNRDDFIINNMNLYKILFQIRQ